MTDKLYTEILNETRSWMREARVRVRRIDMVVVVSWGVVVGLVVSVMMGLIGS